MSSHTFERVNYFKKSKLNSSNEELCRANTIFVQLTFAASWIRTFRRLFGPPKYNGIQDKQINYYQYKQQSHFCRQPELKPPILENQSQ
jgi:hypothetical protein